MIQHRVQSACQAENFKSSLEFISPAEGRIAYARRARRLLSPFRSVSIVAVQELFLGNGESLARRGRPTFPRSCHARTEKTLAMSIRQDVRLHQTCRSGWGTGPDEFLCASLGWRPNRFPQSSDELSFGSRGRVERAFRQSNVSWYTRAGSVKSPR